MAMAPSLQKALITVLLLLVAVRSSAEGAPPPPPSSAVYHMELIHVDAHGNFTMDELIRRAQHRSRARAAALSAAASPSSSSSPAAAAAAAADGNSKPYSETARYSGGDIGEYLVNLSIGTPAKPFLAVADTGSDQTWTRNMELCSSASSTFKQLQCPSGKKKPCKLKKVYGNQNLTAEGFMADENFTLSWCRWRVPFVGCRRTSEDQVRMPLGCAESCSKGCDKLIPKDADGLLGLNQSPDSFLTLLRKNLGITRFSYCLSNRLKPQQSSRLWFGGDGLRLASDGLWPWRDAAAHVQTTPLVSIEAEKNSVAANRYYVELEGVSIGGKGFKKIPGESFKHRIDKGKGKGGGAMFVDSGCSFSKLETEAFNKMKELLLEELGNPEPVDDEIWTRCFKLSDSERSNAEKHTVLRLHFNGATMHLPWSSYMFTTKDQHSCLTIEDRGENISTLGNFQQQNMHMLFDLPGKNLSFVLVKDCSERKM